MYEIKQENKKRRCLCLTQFSENKFGRYRVFVSHDAITKSDSSKPLKPLLGLDYTFNTTIKPSNVFRLWS